MKHLTSLESLPAFSRTISAPRRWLGVFVPLLIMGCAFDPEILLGDAESDNPAGTGGKENGPEIEVPIGGGGEGTGGTSPGELAVCGNGVLEDTELCDDGNKDDGDGCAKSCLVVDPDFFCLTEGEPCVRVVTCGNGVLEGDEACDDKNLVSGDGCSKDCDLVEVGFSCARPGKECTVLPVCGNGLRERGEQCDDGETTPSDGDGCSALCQLEDDSKYYCVPGALCVLRDCGDGSRTPGEDCDDSNTDSGDGCSSACTVETGFRCSTVGCKAICGDGLLKGTETCDDNNKESGDGCSALCVQESYYTCDNSPMPSTCTTTIVCGNGIVDPGEICDYAKANSADCVATGPTACKDFDRALVDPAVCGNHALEYGEECDGGAGCSACSLLDGYSCPAADICFVIPACGDGIVQPGEACDVGAMSGAACDACAVVPGHYCWVADGAVISTCVASVCGDGTIAPNESCDDGQVIPSGGDGCSATCAVESGWVCPPGGSCQPKCGDGVLTGSEQCEETSAGCANCQIKAGYTCNPSGKSCVFAVCGNGITEHGEGCDNDVPSSGAPIAGDGCGATCQVEPVITRGPSPVVNVACGDGMVTSGEDCDDGNAQSGDGCSSACDEESGWSCTESLVEPTSVKLKVTYRDFVARQDANGHPHFKRSDPGSNPSGTDRGITGAICTTANSGSCGRLDGEGKPNSPTGTSTTIWSNPEAFALWYRDTNAENLTGTNGTIKVLADPGLIATPNTPLSTDYLTLARTGTEKYEFSNNNFFPLDTRGYGLTPGQSHNFNFTTELRYFFQYKGAEELVFQGDDDVWVYVNGRLAVDIGGIHGQHTGRVVLGDEDGTCNLQAEDGNTPAACTVSGTEATDNTDDRFALTKNGVYEIVLFHAERNPTGSNFKLTLTGFLPPRSTCVTDCGDGIRAGTELCDAGDANQNNVYGACNTSCSYTFCGDGVQQGSEACDNGLNTDLYVSGAVGAACAPGCKLPGTCGDGVFQPANEVCDDGTNDGGYGQCAAGCQGYAGYCGDNTLQAANEECDSVVKVTYGGTSSTACGFDCAYAPYCGDGVRNGPEHCDGEVNCDPLTCTYPLFCGDGLLDEAGGEACDYGSFGYAGEPANAPYGGCTDECELGPYCGDGNEDSVEECDDGGANADGVYGKCTTACLLGPYCGDGTKQDVFGEACDNGYNEDTYAYAAGACGPNCQAVPFCGDGGVQSAFELCDAGVDNVADPEAAAAYDGCLSTCEWGPYCGDGTVQELFEECDDPDGNVPYSATVGGCGYDCKPAPYCGDGTRNGPEQCDLGEAGNIGEYGGCKADCQLASRCGDGVVQKSEGEACDAGPSGSLSCTPGCDLRSGVK